MVETDDESLTIRGDRKALVYTGNGHVAVDCGCVYGGRLAAYCLDNGQVEYVERKVFM